MPELSTRYPCPVCLGVMMDRVRLGEGEAELEIDHCTRCGGVWFDAGEVERLRAFPSAELWDRIGRQHEEHLPPCHLCHAPLSRHAAKCQACGWKNLIDCPVCDEVMDRKDMVLVTLDVCRNCRGVWFDHFELDILWETASVAAAANEPEPRGAAANGASLAGDIALNTMFYAPDVAGRAVMGAAHAASHIPDALAAAPDAAVHLASAAGEAAGGVFDIISGILEALFEMFDW
ncbi:MAG TPA: zf-TFIIB domain-containing protein [Longimicrobium sp.]|nr:zf-TFIIB domain-containing protein [Longimicrobium sp.]